MSFSGKLYLCATPIGNLKDITLRTLEILAQVDMVAAEDTRKAWKLMSHYEIQKPLLSYFEHNEKERAAQIVELLRQGKNIALVSEAGMPGISDPGYRLIQAVIRHNLPLVPAPGPSSVLTALVVSGFPCDSFVFEGFLPRSPAKKKKLILAMKSEPRTVVLFEAPHRLLKTLALLDEVLGSREIALARELTKKFEEVVRGTAGEILKTFQERTVRGEITLVIKALSSKPADAPLLTPELVGEAEKLVEEGCSLKDAAGILSKKRDIPRRRLYNFLLQEKKAGNINRLRNKL